MKSIYEHKDYRIVEMQDTVEKWNPEIGIGWEHVDSCWGFVGEYRQGVETYDHYIVDELKRQIG